MKSKLLLLLIVLTTLPLLSWCWDDDPCADDPDSRHCYQKEAVDNNDPSQCKNIDWSDFKQYGSNPPKDKCYMMVAASNGDYWLCNKIKWGEMSYSKADCIFEVISAQDDPKGCDLLKWKDRYEECNQTFRSATALGMKDQTIESLIEQSKNDPDNADLKAQIQKEMEAKKAMFPYLTPEEKNIYIKEQRLKIMEGIDDTDVSSLISKEYTAFRAANPTADVITLLDKMKSIADKQEAIKQIDDDANALVDAVKAQMTSVAQAGQDAATDIMKEKAADWIKENGGDKLKWSLKNLEWMKDKYEKGSEAYNSINEKYEKIKWVYDQVNGIYTKMDGLDTLVAQGKLTADKAKVIKWAVLLQNWLTAVTEYVPVFGSTISKITNATFETTIKVAEERAKRTTSLDKCIDDPLNCNTDDISAY
ncbi:MAG: hypothetical protein ACD_80C00111G0006 [uncultured bacterium (gcode 4)]|uniref:Uncharacterized protein n=1 Tax=uncultured bacterium (gcode 4) TaxID=1234023 RepID=K1YIK0_9BACT|nr:MAG: hypothetical protein ACD_80C00111G0006 [uncultured bacterium (gcode 4)]